MFHIYKKKPNKVNDIEKIKFTRQKYGKKDDIISDNRGYLKKKKNLYLNDQPRTQELTKH